MGGGIIGPDDVDLATSDDLDVQAINDEIEIAHFMDAPRFLGLELTNFLSYKSAQLDFADLTALVGPNAHSA